MAARAGIETAYKILEDLIKSTTYNSDEKTWAQHGAQKFGELREMIAAWPSLPSEIRFAIIALARSMKEGRP